MEELLYQRVFEKTYGPSDTVDGLLDFAETLRVREAVQSLRQSYQCI